MNEPRRRVAGRSWFVAGGEMTRFFGQHVMYEMLCLWFIEVFLAFCIAYFLITAGLDPDSLGVGARVSFVHDALIVAITAGGMAFTIGLYRPELFFKTRRLLINTAIAGVLAFPAVWAVCKLAGVEIDGLLGHDALRPVKMLVAWIMLLFATRLAFRIAMRLKVFTRRVVVVGGEGSRARVANAVRAQRRGFIEVVTLPAGVGADSAVIPTAQQLRRSQIRDVIVAGRNERDCGPELQSLAASGISIHAETDFWEYQLRRIGVDLVGADWLSRLAATRRSWFDDAVHRAFDVLLSLALMLVTLPVIAVTAILVKAGSPGPVLYRQERVGLHGKPFTVLKFRSMRVDAEAQGPVWAMQRDPRVTSVGAVIRLTRIDELPQLLNVLRGEMSFIGPRPERPHFVKQLADIVPGYECRTLVKPGLTGWAQVNFPYGASVEDARTKLSYDLYYVRHRNLLLDFLILFATVRVILFQEGAR